MLSTPPRTWFNPCWGTYIPQAVAWSQGRPPEPPTGQAARGGGCGRWGCCELQKWQPRTEQLPEGLRALSRASGLQSHGQREGAGLGRALAYLERAAERLPQAEPEGPSLGGWLRRALLDGLLPHGSPRPHRKSQEAPSSLMPPAMRPLWLASCAKARAEKNCN